MPGERAATLGRLVPRVPVRHWTLTLPLDARAVLGADAVTRIARGFVKEVFALCRSLVAAGASPSVSSSQLQCGAAAAIHRVGAALNPNVHVHVLVLDGAYRVRNGKVDFVPLRRVPSEASLREIAARVQQVLRRYAPAATGSEPPKLARKRGERAAARVATVARLPSEAAGVRGAREGVTVFAGPAIDAQDRRGVAQLARYMTRAPVDTNALQVAADGSVIYQLYRPSLGGTTHVELSRAEFTRRVRALGSQRGGARVSYHGVLAPRAAERWRVVPTQLELEGAETARGPRAAKEPVASRRDGVGEALSCLQCRGVMTAVAVEEHDGRLVALGSAAARGGGPTE